MNSTAFFPPDFQNRFWNSRWTFILVFAVAVFLFPTCCHAQSNLHRLNLSVGALYERGLDVTLSYENERKYHHSWEFFGNLYLKYDEDPVAGHITTNSFWKSYNTWLVGVAYKPCIVRGRNHHGNLRLGGEVGSDLDRFIGGVVAGYEHSLALYRGWEFFFQVNAHFILRAEDLFRTGVALGVKCPL